MTTPCLSPIALAKTFARRVLADPNSFKMSNQEASVPRHQLIEALIEKLPSAPLSRKLKNTLASIYPPLDPLNNFYSWISVSMKSRKLHLASAVLLELMRKPMSEICLLLSFFNRELIKLEPVDRTNADLAAAVRTLAVPMLPYYVSEFTNSLMFESKSRERSDKAQDLICLLSSIYYTDSLDILVPHISKGDWIKAKKLLLDNDMSGESVSSEHIEPCLASWLLASAKRLELSSVLVVAPTPKAPSPPKM